MWVVGQDDTVDERPVVVGDWYGDDWFITQGLASGDRVVVDGTQTLTPDMRVKIGTAEHEASTPVTHP